eukprot:CAMPEP_0116138186 /NCGR_PEP_ID=MMETSP0329-20121206/12652_1 /TAXON_ID=697910 /ORGANISM="Pseudo-nitzschia arenysensis, Strain B593" /LENGTH=465 /DNA_ID=CAMNT_0003633161 /DNA_START=240 /DNA_END=1637 /DNA_ORIENTATION=+
METPNTAMSDDTPLLFLFQKVHFPWQAHYETSLRLLMVRHYEFPVKIRGYIYQAQAKWVSGESPCVAIMRVYEATLLFFLGRLKDGDDETTKGEWYGPNVEVDQVDEIELLLRFFPQVMQEKRPLEGEWAQTPIQAATTNIKSLPFVPIMAELGKEFRMFPENERGGIWNAYESWEYEPWEETALSHIVTNKVILKNEPNPTDDFYRQIDSVSLAVLVRLKEKGFLKKLDIWECVKILLNVTPVRTKQRLQFFIKWDPTILRTYKHQGVEEIYRALCNSLLEVCVWNCYLYHNLDGMLERFTTLLEFGLRYYPDQIGFLFHKDNLFHPGPKPAFPTACNMLGKEAVVRLVNDCISKHIRGRGEIFRNLLVTAATKEEILLDGVYLLVRRDPVELISFLSKDTASKSTRTLTTTTTATATKKPTMMTSYREKKQFFSILLLLISIGIAVDVWTRLSSTSGNIKVEL